MDNDKIKFAAQEALRFLQRVKDLKEATKDPDGQYEYEGKIHKTYPSAPAESGAVRRASMDLTRALAALRRS